MQYINTAWSPLPPWGVGVGGSRGTYVAAGVPIDRTKLYTQVIFIEMAISKTERVHRIERTFVPHVLIKGIYTRAQ